MMAILSYIRDDGGAEPDGDVENHDEEIAVLRIHGEACRIDGAAIRREAVRIEESMSLCWSVWWLYSYVWHAVLFALLIEVLLEADVEYLALYSTIQVCMVWYDYSYGYDYVFD